MLTQILLLALTAVYPLSDRLEIGAVARMRFRYVGAAADSVAGINGEVLKTGLDARARLDLSATFRLADPLQLGAAVRISNEESNQTLYAPDLVSGRLAAGWWWARFQKGIADATAGAYDASFTALTLMRWDPTDNPLGTGASCCAVSVGGLRGTSLEELSEEYKLEGARLVLAPGPLNATLLFALPSLPSEGESYTRYLGGARLRWDFLVPWLQSTASLGLNGLRAMDDESSVNQAKAPPLRSDVASFDLNLPVLDQMALVGELAYALRDDNLALADPELSGSGVNAGIRVGDRENLDIQARYVRFDRNFMPLFRAQSIGRNRQGFRVSASRRSLPIGNAKYLREFEPMIGSEFTHGLYPGGFWVATASARIEPWYGANFGLDGEWRLNTRRDDPNTPAYDETLDATEVIGSLLFVYRFTLQNSVQFKYSLVSHHELTTSYLAHLPGLELNLKI
jgi:hypothetical protein